MKMRIITQLLLLGAAVAGGFWLSRRLSQLDVEPCPGPDPPGGSSGVHAGDSMSLWDEIKYRAKKGALAVWGPADLHEDKDPTKNLERERRQAVGQPQSRTGTRAESDALPLRPALR